MKKILIILAAFIAGIGGCYGGINLNKYMTHGYRENAIAYIAEDEQLEITFGDYNFFIKKTDAVLLPEIMEVDCIYDFNKIYTQGQYLGKFTDWNTFEDVFGIQYVKEVL